MSAPANNIAILILNITFAALAESDWSNLLFLGFFLGEN